MAFRYELPGEDGQMHTIQAEHTEFAVPVNGKRGYIRMTGTIVTNRAMNNIAGVK